MNSLSWSILDNVSGMNSIKCNEENRFLSLEIPVILTIILKLDDLTILLKMIILYVWTKFISRMTIYIFNSSVAIAWSQ